MLNFFKKKAKGASNLKIDLIFQYHNSSSNALILYNLGSKPVFNITVEVINTSQIKFHTNIEHISPKIGELIKLNELANNAGLNFEGGVNQVHIIIRGITHKFIRNEKNFIKV